MLNKKKGSHWFSNGAKYGHGKQTAQRLPRVAVCSRENKRFGSPENTPKWKRDSSEPNLHFRVPVFRFFWGGKTTSRTKGKTKKLWNKNDRGWNATAEVHHHDSGQCFRSSNRKRKSNFLLPLTNHSAQAQVPPVASFELVRRPNGEFRCLQICRRSFSMERFPNTAISVRICQTYSCSHSVFFWWHFLKKCPCNIYNPLFQKRGTCK